MRMFVAVLPPDDVVEDLEEFLTPRGVSTSSTNGDELRWTMPFQWHITLAFLPDVPVRSLDDLAERLTRAGHRRSPFTLNVAGGGAFPNAAHAKVLYAGVEAEAVGKEELSRLATGVRAAANKAGAGADGGPFRPHLTLARSKRSIDATKWLRVLDTYRSRSLEVEEFALIESHLGQGPGNRPRYETVGTFEIGSRGVPSET